MSRRNFLATTGSLMAAAPGVGGGSAHARQESSATPASGAPVPLRKIPIGVFDSALANLTLDEMLDKISALGIEAVEIGAKGQPGSKHCPTPELLADPAKARAWKKKFEDRNIRVGAFSIHGNPIHPDPAIAARDDQFFRNGVLLAELLEVPVVVGFSGCPGGSPTDKTPNWITYRWPPQMDEMLKYQWTEKVIPYWKQAAAFARQHGIHRIALEMHPNFVVYNPHTLIKLREAAGEEIGANCDLSHLFWQGCDAVETVRFLGEHGALYHAHMKDTVIFKHVADQTGVLNFSADLAKSSQGSVVFRTVGYGHGAEVWKDIMKAYMDIGFQGIFSIENEDPILTGEIGVERAAYVLKNVRAELLAEL